MKRLVKVFIIVMSIIYLALLAAPAWSGAPRHETIIFAFSSGTQNLEPTPSPVAL
jgi:hypothetical protein